MIKLCKTSYSIEHTWNTQVCYFVFQNLSAPDYNSRLNINCASLYIVGDSEYHDIMHPWHCRPEMMLPGQYYIQTSIGVITYKQPSLCGVFGLRLLKHLDSCQCSGCYVLVVKSEDLKTLNDLVLCPTWYNRHSTMWRRRRKNVIKCSVIMWDLRGKQLFVSLFH